MKTVAKALVRDKAGNILLLRRSDTHPNFPKHVDFPGGEVELNESCIDAVRREIIEETGLDVPLEDIELVHLKKLSDDLTHVICSIQLQDEKPEITLSWEHSGFEWMTLDQVASVNLPVGVDVYHITVLEYLTRTTV